MYTERLTARQIAQHALRLYDVGLVPLACWGGGKTLPGRDHRALADAPPSRDSVGEADYSGGLAILCGTRHPQGGYVLGVDIDQGPEQFIGRPHGWLLLEAGTRAGKWHLFLRTTDRLDGVLNLYDRSHATVGPDGKRRYPLVAELKGRGHAVRSYPTLPPEKPRGYTVLALNTDAASAPATLTARQVAEGMAHYLSPIVGGVVEVGRASVARGTPGPTPAGLAQALEAELDRRGITLKPAGRDGWMLGRCPLHEDRNPSFSVSWEVGAWHCFAGCGSGGLRSLARRLGVEVRAVRWRRGHPILPDDPVPAKV